MRDLLTRSVFTLDPWVGHDAVSIESFGRFYPEKSADKVLSEFGNVIPVRRRELKGTLLDQLEQRLIVLVVEGRETTKPRPNKETW